MERFREEVETRNSSRHVSRPDFDWKDLRSKNSSLERPGKTTMAEELQLVALRPGDAEVVAMSPGDVEEGLGGAHEDKYLKEKYGKIRFLLPGVNEDAQGYVQQQIDSYPDLKIESTPGRSLRVMEASDLLILSSGTATMEAAYFGTPMVILYKVGWINLLIISLVIRTRVIGMVNLLARKQVAVELLQTEVRPDTIFKHATQILDDPNLQSEIRKELEFVKHSLGKGRPASEAVSHFLQYARERKG